METKDSIHNSGTLLVPEVGIIESVKCSRSNGWLRKAVKCGGQ